MSKREDGSSAAGGDPKGHRAEDGVDLEGADLSGVGLGAQSPASFSAQEAVSGEPINLDPRAGGLGEMLRIALPSVITMTSYTVMQFGDTWMVSRIEPPDPVYVAAVGNGGIASWLFASCALGINSIINTYVSQHLGAGTVQKAPAYAWAGLWISLVFGLLAIPMVFLVGPMFSAIGHEGRMLELETGYAQILFMCSGLLIAGRSLHHFFYGLHRPKIVMISAISGNIVNLFVNWVLIYGNLGAPEMGVMGAAIGTVTGVTIELAIPLALFLGPKMHRELKTRTQWRCGLAPVRDIFRLGWPGGMMFLNEMLCWSYLMAGLLPLAGMAAASMALDQTGSYRGVEVVGGANSEMGARVVEQAGVAANTAGWIALRFMHASFMPAVGLSFAVTALVGKAMGMGRPDIAAARAWLGLKVAVIYMGLCALVFVMFRETLIGVFIKSPDPEDVEAVRQAAEVLRIGALVMIAAAVFQVFDAVAITLSAALRGAGDTIWPGVATLALSWICIVGLGLVMIELAPQLGSMGPWIAASAYIVALGIALLLRFLAGGWKSRRVVRDEAPATL